jgi:hypothetical protein
MNDSLAIFAERPSMSAREVIQRTFANISDHHDRYIRCDVKAREKMNFLKTKKQQIQLEGYLNAKERENAYLNFYKYKPPMLGSYLLPSPQGDASRE